MSNAAAQGPGSGGFDSAAANGCNDAVAVGFSVLKNQTIQRECEMASGETENGEQLRVPALGSAGLFQALLLSLGMTRYGGGRGGDLGTLGRFGGCGSESVGLRGRQASV